MNIGILGAGNVGATLGKRWAASGQTVRFGVRDASKTSVVEAVAACGAGTSAVGVVEAAAFGEVIVLATPWEGVRDALRAAGPMSGKVLIDCTNPLLPGLAGLEVGHTASGGETVAALVPEARVVKCFNTTGAGNMERPTYSDARTVMFLAGDDPSAKSIVLRLGEEIGFDMIDAGPLAASRLLEPLAMLWISLAYQRGLGRDFAFRLVRR